MPLVLGTKLGPYEVVGPLGAGGMGEVYRATDTKLRREVALKVLPQSVATDAERMARFEREAQLLAALNHPNIAAIYGLEDSDSTRALVIELVEGSTLAERIAQGPIPADEAFYIRANQQTMENKLVWAEHDAKPQPFPLKANVYESPRFSPDGKQIALTVRLPDIDVWIYDLDRGSLRRITFAPGEDEVPVWSPDAKRIAFASNGRQQAFVVAADGRARKNC